MPQIDSSVVSLPLGTVQDPIQDFLLATTWVGLSEHLIADSETGELDPVRASQWSLRSTNTSNVFGLLFNFVDYLMSLLSNESTLVKLLGTSVDDSIEVDVSGAFRNLTNTPPLLQVSALDITMLPGKLLGSYGAFLTKEVLDAYMFHIFEEPYGEHCNEEFQSTSVFKTCPKDSITYRIAVSLCLVLCNHGGLKGFAQLWRCIVEQFRHHYEKSKPIPGVSCRPDPAFSLLHQKIQMLNACVAQKKERESALYTSTEGEDLSDHQTAHPTLHLLLTGEKLCVPMTQRHPPMTEDMQEEHMEALANLGSSAEGSRLRAQLHSFSLLSDMQAFKAANTNSRLEDFIRWYSPRDWIVVPITKPVIPESADMIRDELTDALEKSPKQSKDLDGLQDTGEEVDSPPPEDIADEESVVSPKVSGDVIMDEPAASENFEQADNPHVSEESASIEMQGNIDVQASVENERDVDDDRNETVDLEEASEIQQEETARSLNNSEENEKNDNTEEYIETVDINVVKCDVDEESRVEDEGIMKDPVEPAQEDCKSSNSQSDDEFVDAEDDFFNSEKSESLFKSVSEASERFESTLPPSHEVSDDDEFALSHISEDQPMSGENQRVEKANQPEPKEDEPAEDGPTEDGPAENKTPIYNEPPLDPDVCGGHLSVRMAKESVWKEAWQVAKPIPIWHQKRLFDDTKEAERILHHFTHSKIKDISLLMVPAVLHAAYDRLVLSPDSSVPFVKERLEALEKKLKDLHRYPSDDVEYFKEIITEIHDIEILLSKFYSLQKKLSHQEAKMQTSESGKQLTELERRTRRTATRTRGSKLTSQVSPSKSTPDVGEEELLQQLISGEVELSGAGRSIWGSVLQRLFHAQQIAAANKRSPHGRTSPGPRHVPLFPLPVGREYILQTTTRHPSPVSRVCPQRMFATVSGNEFRVAFAHTSDKTFL